MNLRFARTGTIALAMGLVLSGGAAALAAGTHSHPASSIKFKEGKKFPSPATRFDGALVDGKVYFLGFRIDDAGTTDGSVWYYDTKKDKYVDTKTDMPTPVSNYEVAVLKDKTGTGLYIFGGRDQDGAIVQDVQVYYPKTNKAVELSKKDQWPGTTPSDCVSLPATGVAVVKNTAYVIGGMSFSSSIPACVDDNSNQVWAFNPTGKAGKKWKAMPKLNQARGYIATAVDGNTIYAIGGDTNESAALVAQPTVESWTVGDKKWDDKGVADLPEACDESQAFAFGGTVTLAGCGVWGGTNLPDVNQLDIKKNKWSNVGSLNEARRNQAGENIGTVKNPKLMIVGGYNSDATVILDTSEFGTVGKFAGRPGQVTGGVSSASKGALF